MSSNTDNTLSNPQQQKKQLKQQQQQSNNKQSKGIDITQQLDFVQYELKRGSQWRKEQAEARAKARSEKAKAKALAAKTQQGKGKQPAAAGGAVSQKAPPVKQKQQKQQQKQTVAVAPLVMAPVIFQQPQPTGWWYSAAAYESCPVTGVVYECQSIYCVYADGTMVPHSQTRNPVATVAVPKQIVRWDAASI
jgi:hypothetical protein